MEAFQEIALLRIREFLMFSGFPNWDFSELQNLVWAYHSKMCAAWSRAEIDAAMQSGLQSRFDLLLWMLEQGECFDRR
jgi:hypothetical protein